MSNCCRRWAVLGVVFYASLQLPAMPQTPLRRPCNRGRSGALDRGQADARVAMKTGGQFACGHHLGGGTARRRVDYI
jgi:hypothetical protein